MFVVCAWRGQLQQQQKQTSRRRPALNEKYVKSKPVYAEGAFSPKLTRIHVHIYIHAYANN